MRILAIGNMYPPHHLGGYELVWQGTMRRAREAGHAVRIITTGHREAGAGGEGDPNVHRELEWYWHDHGWREMTPLARLGLERRNGAILRRHLAEFRPDLVAFWSMGGMSLSLVERLARSPVPSALVVHDDWLVYGPRADQWMRMWARRPVLRRAIAAVSRIPSEFQTVRRETVLGNSEYVLGRAREHGYRFDRASVISPGIDRGFLAPAKPNTDDAWTWRLLYVGRLDRQKGVDVALEALSALPSEATLTIAGSGDLEYERELRDRAERRDLSGRVEFAGKVERRDLPALYQSADAVVFPVRWKEPFGLVPLEAMAAGTPVVATARGGAAEFLRDGENALVVPADDEVALAQEVERLARDEELRRRLWEGGMSTAAANTADRFERRMIEAFESTVAA